MAVRVHRVDGGYRIDGDWDGHDTAWESLDRRSSEECDMTREMGTYTPSGAAAAAMKSRAGLDKGRAESQIIPTSR